MHTPRYNRTLALLALAIGTEQGPFHSSPLDYQVVDAFDYDHARAVMDALTADGIDRRYRRYGNRHQVFVHFDDHTDAIRVRQAVIDAWNNNHIALPEQGPLTYQEWMALDAHLNPQPTPDPAQDMANEGGMLYS